MDIEAIRNKIACGDYRFSDHAVKRMIERIIDRNEVEEVVQHGIIIEKYPDDKYSPSCLISGRTLKKRNLHVQASLPPRVVIVTVYEPDPEAWMDGGIRR